MFRKVLRLIKKFLPQFLPVPYLYKNRIKFLTLPKHHWTQYMQGLYEKETLEKTAEILKNKKIKTVWDIGANAGIYTIFIAKNHNCVIHAFEPTKKYYKILKENIRHLKKVYAHNFGIGSKDEKSSIVITEEPGSNHVVNKFTNSKNSKLDDCYIKNIKSLKKISKPDFAKIDVEGYEYEILSSSLEFFAEHSTKLIVEINDKNMKRYTEKKEKDIFKLLDEANFTYKRIDNSHNYFCFMRES